MQLSELVNHGYSEKKELNCAETIRYGANKVYGLGLDHEALKLAAGFGGGMGIEATCGALTGAFSASPPSRLWASRGDACPWSRQ